MTSNSNATAHPTADPSTRRPPELPLRVSETGPADAPRTALVLHGGGGPLTVAGIAAHLSRTTRVLTPTHPGWDGAERPDWLTGVPALADVYLDLLAAAGHRSVLLVGSSIGGWIAAEMAARDTSGVVGGLVVIDGVGITVDAHPIRDFFALDARGVAEYSYHDPDRFYVDPAALTDDQRAQRAANMVSLRALAGDPYMHDPTLAPRLADITVPSLVLWGESDRIATSGYGRALAGLIPTARFELILRAGHLPQIERPEAVFDALDTFVDTYAATPAEPVS